MSDITAPEEPARAETIPVTIDVPSGLLPAMTPRSSGASMKPGRSPCCTAWSNPTGTTMAATAPCGSTFGGRKTRGRIRRPTMPASRTRSPRRMPCGMRRRASRMPVRARKRTASADAKAGPEGPTSPPALPIRQVARSDRMPPGRSLRPEGRKANAAGPSGPPGAPSGNRTPSGAPFGLPRRPSRLNMTAMDRSLAGPAEDGGGAPLTIRPATRKLLLPAWIERSELLAATATRCVMKTVFSLQFQYGAAIIRGRA